MSWHIVRQAGHNLGKTNRNNPMDEVHGKGNGKNRHGITHASLGSHAEKKQQGAALHKLGRAFS